MESQEFKDGEEAYKQGLPKTDNPYIADSKWDRGFYNDWNRGWEYAERHSEDQNG